MKMIPKRNTRCSECIWSKFSKGDSLMASGYICRLNPLRPIGMGYLGRHSNRSFNKKTQKDYKFKGI